MSSRSSNTKQEVFSYAWSSIPGVEASASEKAFAYSWSSLPGQEAKGKEKAFSYSWSSPDSDPPLEPAQPDAAEAQNPSPAQDAAKPTEANPGVLHDIAGRFFEGGFPSFRSIGVISWSAIAGSGAIVALADAGPSVATQLGSIGGLWLGVTAAIWFLPRVIH